MVGIEVKASATVNAGDFKGLRKLADACGDNFKLGVVLYDGGRPSPSVTAFLLRQYLVCGGDSIFAFERHPALISPAPHYGLRYGFAPATGDFQRLRGRPPLVSPLKSCMGRFHGGNTGSNPVGDAKSFSTCTCPAPYYRHKKGTTRAGNADAHH